MSRKCYNKSKIILHDNMLIILEGYNICIG